MKKKSSKIIILALVFSIEAHASPIKRIRSVVVDKGEIQRVSMVAGLASVILFPCDVDEAVVGRQEDLKALVSPTTKKQLTLSLTHGASGSTNLLVRCGDKKDPFVFDVIATRSIHQDVLRIRGHFGGPDIEDAQLSLIDSSETKSKADRARDTISRPAPRIFNVKSPRLIEEEK